MRFTFLCPSGLECWDHSRPEGIAGSETCVAEISRRLAKRGHEVLVYAPTFPDTEDDPNDGYPVKWGHIFESDIDMDAPGVWWLCRHPPLVDFFQGRPDQQLFLRCDDIHYGTGDCPSALTEARAAKFKHILCMSEPHKHYFLQAYPFLDPGKISTLGCGIASDRMMKLPFVDRDPYRLIWVSSPDRGLDAMIRIFHQARQQEPRLNLHVYYGWDGCEKASRGNPNDPRMQLKRWCTEVADQTNITWHGRVGKETLWRGHLSSTLLVYPTQFVEAGVVSVQEAQALGAIPVCPPFAGLAEKVKNGVFILSDPADPDHEQRYVDSILALVRDPDLCRAIREAMQPWALETYSWDQVINHHEFLAGHPWVVSVDKDKGGRLAIGGTGVAVA